jgi:hypothetical protein
MIIHRFFDVCLTLRVKRTGSSSDKALGQYQQRLGPCTSDTGFNGWALHPVSFANNDYLFALKFHL